jgi:hypothetical protein
MENLYHRSGHLIRHGKRGNGGNVRFRTVVGIIHISMKIYLTLRKPKNFIVCTYLIAFWKGKNSKICFLHSRGNDLHPDTTGSILKQSESVSVVTTE